MSTRNVSVTVLVLGSHSDPLKIEGGRWGWVGQGGAVRGKWKQLYWNNNKKIEKKSIKILYPLQISVRYSFYPSVARKKLVLAG